MKYAALRKELNVPDFAASVVAFAAGRMSCYRIIVISSCHQGCVGVKCQVFSEARKRSLMQTISDPMIRKLANDHHLFIHINRMSCLIAPEAKYHSMCIERDEETQEKEQMQMKECGKSNSSSSCFGTQIVDNIFPQNSVAPTL